ncbi:MAG TPA: methylated-DNA--[protein]-cysteine S-methyltransferase [Polyangiaceae bacterium]|nr:methylated-DNA--[protein]-cysteine S-methyltransferase [Polyangiaceae bacterium]
MQGIYVFETAIGPCGIAWGPRGITGIQLPEASQKATLARLARRFPKAEPSKPPPHVASAVTWIRGLLAGKAEDLSRIELDFADVSPFYRRVYEFARSIPPGTTLSYGDLAARMGSAGSARAVGQALGKNPFAIVVPCHRVLAAGGKLGGFSAHGGTQTKQRLLELERDLMKREPSAPKTPEPSLRRPGTLGAFRFDVDAAVAELCANDRALARWIERIGPFEMRVEETASLFMALARSIVYQQLSGKAAGTIFGRFCGLFPGSPTAILPALVDQKTDAELRGVGLSRNKLLALRDLSAKAQAGVLPSVEAAHEIPEEELIERLTQVRGIGRWTVEMLMMFRLGRPDILPLDDLGIRKGFQVAFKTPELPARAQLEKRGERWRPYRTVASWYLWRIAEFEMTRSAAKKSPVKKTPAKP